MKKILISLFASTIACTATASDEKRAVTVPYSKINEAAQNYLTCATETVRSSKAVTSYIEGSSDCATKRERLDGLLVAAGIPDHMVTVENAARDYRAARTWQLSPPGSLESDELVDAAPSSALEFPGGFTDGADEAVTAYYECVTLQQNFRRSLEEAKAHCASTRKTLHQYLGGTAHARTVLSQIDALLMNRWLRMSAGRTK